MLDHAFEECDEMAEREEVDALAEYASFHHHRGDDRTEPPHPWLIDLQARPAPTGRTRHPGAPISPAWDNHKEKAA